MEYTQIAAILTLSVVVLYFILEKILFNKKDPEPHDIKNEDMRFIVLVKTPEEINQIILTRDQENLVGEFVYRVQENVLIADKNKFNIKNPILD